MTTKPVPGPARNREKQPVLPPPRGQAEKAETAKQARALGRTLRTGKRVLFGSRRHLAR
jgi:hypothetical protein